MNTPFQSTTKAMASFGNAFSGHVATDPEPPKPKTPWYRRIAEWYVLFLDRWNPWRLRAHLSEQLDFNVRTLAQLKEVEELMLEMRSERDAAIRSIESFQSKYDDLLQSKFAENGKLDAIRQHFEETKGLIDKIIEEHRPFKNHIVDVDKMVKDLTFDEAVKAMKVGKKCYPVSARWPGGWFSFRDGEWIGNCGERNQLGKVRSWKNCQWRIVEDQ